MRAGQLDRRIDILAVTSGSDQYAQPTLVETVVASVWAQFVQQSGREYLNDGTTETETKAVFRIRYMAGIKTDHVIAFGTDRWNVNEVREIGRREGLELFATRRT